MTTHTTERFFKDPSIDYKTEEKVRRFVESNLSLVLSKVFKGKESVKRLLQNELKIHYLYADIIANELVEKYQDAIKNQETPID
ncbi:MAG: hypothetical protein Fur0024_5230 [Patescibacteria group bacterium]